METIIHKAIEGGLIYDKTHTPTNAEFCVLVCNSSFWQTLGKACGWKNEEYVTCLYGCQIMFGGEGCHHNISPRDKPRIPFWQYHALKFHEINLTQSWDDAVKYLTSVI